MLASRSLRPLIIGGRGEKDSFLEEALRAHLSEKPMTVAEYFGDELAIEYYYRHPRSYARRGVFSVHEPSPTIRGVSGPVPGGYQLKHNDPVRTLEGVRALSTVERSRIQTFPQDFTFVGSKTEVEQMVGNAVPVNLAGYVAKCLMNWV